MLVERTRRIVRFTALGERITGQSRARLTRGRRTGRNGAGRRQAAARRAADGGHPDHRALPVAGDATSAAQRMAKPQALSSRGDEPGGLRGLAPGAARLRPARPPLCLRTTSISSALFDDRLFVAFPQGEAPRGETVEVDAIDEKRMLLLEDGHCLKDHALSACNRPELRAHAAMMGLRCTRSCRWSITASALRSCPSMAIEAGILDGTQVDAKPLRSDHGFRRVASLAPLERA